MKNKENKKLFGKKADKAEDAALPPEENKEINAKPAAEKDPEAVQRRKQKLLTALIISAAAVLLLVASMAYGGYCVTNNGVNLPNVYANGVAVGGMSREETQALLAEKGFDKASEGSLRVQLPADVSFEIDYSSAGSRLDSRGAAELAYSYGHSGNWFSNLFKFVGNVVAPVDIIHFDKSFDYDYIMSGIEKAVGEFDEKTADAGYELDAEKGFILLRKGAGQLSIDKDKLYTQIVQALLADSHATEYVLPEKNLRAPDYEKIAGELRQEAMDASFDENFDVKPSQVGIELDVARAKRIWEAAEPGNEVRLPLIITPPAVSSEQLREMLFRDKLGSQITHFTWSSDNRINNIKLVSDKLDGMIMMPGDVFSFNGYVGQRTAEAGFKPAGAYMNGIVVEEVGGGICQVSSTLYCSVLLAQLEIVERTCHYFLVDYLPPGLDATVSWPDTDFKFKNCREYPIMLKTICDTEAKSITIEVWGTDVDGSYVELEYGVGTWYDDEYPEVAIGKTAACYRVIYDKDGNRIATKPEAYSAYNFHPGEIQWPEDKDKEDEDGEEGEEGGEGGTDPGEGGTDPGTGGTDPGTGGTDPGTGDDGNVDGDGNIVFG